MGRESVVGSLISHLRERQKRPAEGLVLRSIASAEANPRTRIRLGGFAVIPKALLRSLV